jgi:hypothetical protein
MLSGPVVLVGAIQQLAKQTAMAEPQAQTVLGATDIKAQV